jgi:pSer/pThr/pTyr-binding forkhead associated (FHA) protein
MMSNPSQFTLYVQSGPQAGQTFTLVDGSQIIGRAAGSQIQINETTVSKQHARVTVQTNGAFVEDLNSANGTYLNGQRVTTSTWLKPGDSLRIGTNTVVEVRGAAGTPLAAASAGRGRGVWVALVVLLLLAGIGAATWFILQSNPTIQPTPTTAVAEQPPATTEPTAAPAVDLVFTSDRTSVEAGQCVTLRWQVKEAKEVRLDGERVPDAGEREVCPQEVTKTYRLTALSQAGDTQEETLTLTVPPTATPPADVEITFTADDTTVDLGECVNLRWLVENAQEVRLDNQKVSPAGTQQVCPESSTNTYTLLVLPAVGDDIIDQTIIINVPPTAVPATATSPPSPTATPRSQEAQVQNPIIDQFIAEKNTLNEGECTTLRWTVRNAQGVRLDGATVANQGSQRVCPGGSGSNHNLVATGAGGGSAQSSLSISVSASTNNSGGGQSTSGGSNSNSPLVLALGGQHRYEEPWGAPVNNDPCSGNTNDENPNFRGFNVELKLTNNTDTKVSDEWGKDLRFTTASGGKPRACYHYYEGMGPAPKGTVSVTFFTIVAQGDFVERIELNHNGQTVRLCLNGGGGTKPC